MIDNFYTLVEAQVENKGEKCFFFFFWKGRLIVGQIFKFLMVTLF